MSDKKFWFPSFTLLEMILAMIVAAIIISLIFSVFQKLRETWTPFHSKQERLNALLFFKKTFEEDIDNAASIRTTENAVCYLFSVKDTIQYTFGSFVVRKSCKRTDTFSVSIKNINMICIPSLLPLKIVSQLEFDIIEPIEVAKVKFIKHYASNEVMALLK